MPAGLQPQGREVPQLLHHRGGGGERKKITSAGLLVLARACIFIPRLSRSTKFNRQLLIDSPPPTPPLQNPIHCWRPFPQPRSSPLKRFICVHDFLWPPNSLCVYLRPLLRNVSKGNAFCDYTTPPSSPPHGFLFFNCSTLGHCCFLQYSCFGGSGSSSTGPISRLDGLRDKGD